MLLLLVLLVVHVRCIEAICEGGRRVDGGCLIEEAWGRLDGSVNQLACAIDGVPDRCRSQDELKVAGLALHCVDIDVQPTNQIRDLAA